MLITKVQIFRPPDKRGQKRTQFPCFQQFQSIFSDSPCLSVDCLPERNHRLVAANYGLMGANYGLVPPNKTRSCRRHAASHPQHWFYGWEDSKFSASDHKKNSLTTHTKSHKKTHTKERRQPHWIFSLVNRTGGNCIQILLFFSHFSLN